MNPSGLTRGVRKSFLSCTPLLLSGVLLGGWGGACRARAGLGGGGGGCTVGLLAAACCEAERKKGDEHGGGNALLHGYSSVSIDGYSGSIGGVSK